MNSVQFENKTFCFTGGMEQLKRTKAEREVRSRQGLSQKSINSNLDYLVVGSKPSPAWKYGDYGTKINKARSLINEGAKTQIIPESKFMEALESTMPIDSGEIDEKILICRYRALVSNGEFDILALNELLSLYTEADEYHVTATIEEPYIYKDLYLSLIHI